MEKLYLVVHKYKNSGDAVYLVEKKNISSFVDEYEGRDVKIYEWDSSKIGMNEVEYLAVKEK